MKKPETDVENAKYCMSEDAIKIHLPKVKQLTSYSCGASALMSITTYFRVGPQEEREFRELLQSNSIEGTTPKNIVKVARMFKLHAYARQNMNLDQLRARLDKRIPVICCLQAWGDQIYYKKDYSGHYVVAIGFDESYVYFEDPSLKYTRGFLENKEFVRRWHDVDAFGNKYNQFGIAIWKDKGRKRPENVTDSVKIL